MANDKFHINLVQLEKEIIQASKTRDSYHSIFPIFEDWICRYDLYNPENFLDPDHLPEWYSGDQTEHWEYYDKRDPNEAVNINFFLDEEEWLGEKIEILPQIQFLLENKEKLSGDFYDLVFNYVYENHSWANSKHFDYALKCINKAERTCKNREVFIKNMFGLSEILFSPSKVEFIFKCSFDTEHGLSVTLIGGVLRIS